MTAEWLVDSINGLVSGGSISREFVGLILLPIVGNAAEHVTAVTVSVKDKLTLSLGVAVGSSIVSLNVFNFSPHHLPYRIVILTSNERSTANRSLRDSIHRHPRMDDGQAAHAPLRPVRVCRAVLGRVDGELCRPRWKVELARGHDLDVYVFFFVNANDVLR